MSAAPELKTATDSAAAAKSAEDTVAADSGSHSREEPAQSTGTESADSTTTSLPSSTAPPAPRTPAQQSNHVDDDRAEATE